MEVRYSEKDQALIDEYKKNLEDYDKLLLIKLMQHTSDRRDIERMFLSDSQRDQMVRDIADLLSVLMPVYVITLAK